MCVLFVSLDEGHLVECLDRPVNYSHAILSRYNCTQHVAIKGIICVNHAQDYHWINYTSLIPPPSVDAHQLLQGRR